MTGEVRGIGAQGGLKCEEERAPMKVGEFETAAAGKDGFSDVRLGELDAQDVVYSPKACI